MTTARVFLAFLLTLTVSSGLAAQSAQELYQRGLVQEQANGDLAQAISLYTQAARAAGKDRGLAARALIRVAGAHEKLGRPAEAVSAYAEVVRAYPEQRAEVAIARDRLRALDVAYAANRTPLPIDRVAGTELAVRVATFIWNSAPDAALLEAAQRGDLGELSGLTREVVRMLRDPRSDSLVDGFFSEWLSLDRLKKAQPDPAIFPQADADLLQAMATETRLFLQSQLRDDRDAMELWTASYTFVNERLARHYGMSGVSGSEFRRVSWPGTDRAGLLGQAGLLTALSFPSRTSPTTRGTYVMTRVLGMEVPAPPANVPPLAEPSGNRPGTVRNRMAAHKLNPSCASCHSMFDPLGFALENFDATGVWRTADGGVPIDASGAFIDGTRFNGPAELRAGFLRYRDAYYTGLTQQLLAYALNRKGKGGRVYDYEMPVVRTIVRDAAAASFRWSSIVAGIVASPPFQMKTIVP